MAEMADTLATLGSMDDEELLEIARERFKEADEAESEWRVLAEEDARFRAGDQWDPAVKALRSGRGANPARPCLTINRLQGNIRQITNGQRINKVGISINPVDSDADIDTANVIQGLIRHIEKASFATHAYEWAFTDAVVRGKGYFRICVEYDALDNERFERDVRVRRIRNPLDVYFDPTTRSPVFDDANWAFIVTRMSKRAFLTQFPHAEHGMLDSWANWRTPWVSANEVQVAEYFFIERSMEEVVALADGRVMLAADAPDNVEIIDRRPSLRPTVHHIFTNGFEVLERYVFPGKFIPIIPMLGDEVDIGGKMDYVGVVRYAKDSQRAINIWASAGAELIAMSPKTPVVGATGQFEGHERKWNTVNNVPFPYVEYNLVDVGGRPAPKPERLAGIDPNTVQAITLERQQANDDLKSTTGIHDASMGARSNETSGVAIMRRQQQGDISTLHLTDSKSMAIWHAGRVIVGMLPSVYNDPRTARIVGEDDTERLVKLNETFIDDNGQAQLYDMSTGKYDVDVNVGQSFGTRRQEALDLTVNLVDKYPALFEVAGDLMLKNIDGPGAEEMASRFRKTVDPQLLDEEGASTTEERLQVQVAQLSQQVEQATAQNEALTAQVEMQTQQLKLAQQELLNREKEVALKEQELRLKEREMEAEDRQKRQELQLKEEIEREKLDLQEMKLAIDAGRNSK